MIQEGNEASLLEVKTAKGNAKSAKAVIKGKANRHASKWHKVTGKNFSHGSYYCGLPHYALLFLLKGLKEKLHETLKDAPVTVCL